MKKTDNKLRYSKIAVFVSRMGFKLNTGFTDGMFYHEMFPHHVFDLSACNDSQSAITSTIFKEIVKIGEQNKQQEIMSVLGIKSTLDNDLVRY